ncbi:hypothetical protein GWN28_28790, partial [candidate division KSB1 bacterium]|nr:hypothetical protein [candidate division KSB1 bacterium]NIS27689.1 hypothetical protein [candidate division KSB1 bacterium]NIU91943.1 hypothetical protein [candidate division KSB1 bacterium]NIW22264.1 hypothetical protein [candidate division KSB1 bacterium]NIW72854.1 hypothetical protein [candidate division KSB1 bacterium]
MEANIVTIVLPLIGGGIGYYLKHLIEKRKDLVSEVNKERRELYQKFINLVVDIFKGAKKPNPKHDKLISELYDFYKKYILYASPAVINRFWDYFQYLYKQESGSEDHRL